MRQVGEKRGGQLHYLSGEARVSRGWTPSLMGSLHSSLRPAAALLTRSFYMRKQSGIAFDGKCNYTHTGFYPRILLNQSVTFEQAWELQLRAITSLGHIGSPCHGLN